MTEPIQNWREICDGTIKKLEMGAQFGLDVRFDPDAAAAMARVLTLMCETIDIATHGFEVMRRDDEIEH